MKKKVTATGASLHEVAAAMRQDRTLTLPQALQGGRDNAKARERKQYGTGGKAKDDFLRGALGNGIGGALSGMIDSEENKQRKKEEARDADASARFEGGSKGKRSFLSGLLGEGLGGRVAKATTSNKSKTKTLAEFMEKEDQKGSKELIALSKIKQDTQEIKQHLATKTTKPEPKPKMTADRADAHKALASLGYKKDEIEERLKNAPEGANTQELIKHGLNPTATPIKKADVPAAVAAVKPDSQQSEATGIAKSEDDAKAIKDNADHNKHVDAELKKIEDKMGSGGGLIDAILAALFASDVWKTLYNAGKWIWEVMKDGWEIIKSAGKWIGETFMKGWEWAKNFLKSIGKKFGLVAEEASSASEGAGAAAEGADAAGKVAGVGGKAAGAVEVAGEGAVAAAGAVGAAGKAGKAAGLLSKVGSVAKGLGVVGSAVDVGTGVYDLAQGKAQEELHGMDYLSPMRMGMWAGNKINKGVAAVSGGEDLSEMVSRGFGGDSYDPNKKNPGVAKGVIARAPAKTPEQVAKIQEDHRDAQNDAHDDRAADIKQTIVQASQATIQATTKAAVGAAKSAASSNGGGGGEPNVSIRVRNDESTAAAYIAQVFDHPASWGGSSRM